MRVSEISLKGPSQNSDEAICPVMRWSDQERGRQIVF
jgi:hypothetical protein